MESLRRYFRLHHRNIWHFLCVRTGVKICKGEFSKSRLLHLHKKFLQENRACKSLLHPSEKQKHLRRITLMYLRQNHKKAPLITPGALWCEEKRRRFDEVPFYRFQQAKDDVRFYYFSLADKSKTCGVIAGINAQYIFFHGLRLIILHFCFRRF